MDAQNMNEGLGYPLNVSFEEGTGLIPAKAKIMANTPVAIVGIFAFTMLGCAMLTQDHWRPQRSELALDESDDGHLEA